VALLVARLAAIVGPDFKKIIALRTMSQVAFIFIIVSIGAPIIGMFHLLTHALFKSRLFIRAGGFIHLGRSNQDTRMRHYYKFRWRSMIGVGLPVLSLCGLTAMSGFVSKEIILLFSTQSGVSLFSGLMLMSGVVFTFGYSGRLCYRLVRPIREPVHLIYDNKFLFTRRVVLITGRVVAGSGVWT